MNNEIKEILEALRDSIDDTGTDKVNFINWVDKIEDYITNLQKENERLLHIAKKMHTFIFLNTDNEQEVYDKLGLTKEENIMLGYGQIIIKSGDDNE